MAGRTGHASSIPDSLHEMSPSGNCGHANPRRAGLPCWINGLAGKRGHANGRPSSRTVEPPLQFKWCTLSDRPARETRRRRESRSREILFGRGNAARSVGCPTCSTKDSPDCKAGWARNCGHANGRMEARRRRVGRLEWPSPSGIPVTRVVGCQQLARPSAIKASDETGSDHGKCGHANAYRRPLERVSQRECRSRENAGRRHLDSGRTGIAVTRDRPAPLRRPVPARLPRRDRPRPAEPTDRPSPVCAPPPRWADRRGPGCRTSRRTSCPRPRSSP